MAVIFPRPWYASVPVWASRRMSVIPAILHHPQPNAFVQRYHRTYQQECLALDRPTSLEQARQVTEAFTQHDHVERPTQALSCGNQPPHTAFPSLPNLPPLVDPDHWLHALDGLHLERKVNRHGQVSVDLKLY